MSRTVFLDSFSGGAAVLPRGHRGPEDVLAALVSDPRVSTFDMSDIPWLRTAIAKLTRQGLIVAVDEPYPWHKYEITERGA